MKIKYEAWEHDLGVAFSDDKGIEELKNKGLLGSDPKLIHVILADTPEEATAVHYIKMGFDPYKPLGKLDQCIDCDSIYYPEDSNMCPKCGLKS